MSLSTLAAQRTDRDARDRQPLAAIRRSAAGFTLSELVIVILVVSILASMAVPSITWIGSANERVAATRLRTTLIFAQNWALDTGNSTWVAFDTTSDTVTVFVEDPANPGQAGRMPMTDPLTLTPMLIPLATQGVAIASVDIGTTSEVQFDADGFPLNASGVSLTADGLVGLGGGSQLRITRTTGLVTVD